MNARHAFERIRPWVVTSGLLCLLIAFLLAAHAVRRDHALRMLHQWNGVTGTSTGIPAHHANEALAATAARLVELMTGVLGMVLLVPRAVESAWFRWCGWLAIVARWASSAPSWPAVWMATYHR
jgi:hypothetical protein